MKRPEEDLVNRTIVWDAMHLLWLDTDVDEFHFDDVAKICAGTDYTLNELEKIYWAEVYPCMRYNLMPWDVAGEWLAQDSKSCLLYTSPSPRDKRQSRMPSSA